MSSERVLAGQAAILERIATGAPLTGTLDAIVRLVELQIPGAIASCLLVDREQRRLRCASAAGLPSEYNAVIDGLEIAPDAGSCGAAAALGAPVYVRDTWTDWRWVRFRAAARAHGLRACWSMPIRSRRDAVPDQVLGTFAVYLREPVDPSPEHEEILRRAEYLTCVALESSRALEVLHEEREFYRSIVDHATDAFFLHEGKGGRILDVNRQACESLGYSREELIGRLPLSFNPAFSEEQFQALGRALARGETARFESVHARKNGESFPVEVRIRGFEFRGRWLNVALVHDISERRRMEEEMRQVLKLDAVGRLAGGVAHDFNNVLTVINGCTELLERALPADSPWREDVAAIREAGERAATLTAQLLAFSRRSIVEPRPLDLNTAVSGLAGMFQRLLGETIALETRLAPELPAILADEGQIQQVLMNLVVNARDAMPDGGGLSIETSLLGNPDARRVSLSVADTGSGMSAEVLAKAFEPFFTTRRAGRGVGMGLATVYGIVTQAGGSVRIESEPGAGCRVTAEFPAAAAPAEVAQRVFAAPGGSETVLLVEDQDEVRQVARRALEAGGYRVLCAASGEHALALEGAHAGDLHLLVTDVVMPGLGGRRLADAIRARRPSCRVLFVSGYTDDEILRHGVTSARDPFLQKPFTPSSLLSKVREVLDAPRRRPRAPRRMRAPDAREQT